MTESAIPAGEPANPTATWTEADWAEFGDRLYRLNIDCGSAGADDRIRVLASACIEEGVNVVGRIINALVPLGFDRQQVAAILTRDRGAWFRVGPGGVVILRDG